MTPNSPDGAMGEGIAIDAAGNVFTAEAQLRGVTKVRQELKEARLTRLTNYGTPRRNACSSVFGGSS